MIDRSFSSDSRELAGLPGIAILFSFNLETSIGSKSKKTSLYANKYTSESIKLYPIKV
jgi:hypothetical protein